MEAISARQAAFHARHGAFTPRRRYPPVSTNATRGSALGLTPAGCGSQKSSRARSAGIRLGEMS
jgi:hypothetical protein